MSRISRWWAGLFDCPHRKNKTMKDDTRKINEVFYLPNGVKLRVCENTKYLGRCKGCYFKNSNGVCERTPKDFSYTGSCSNVFRTDEKSVIFKEIKEEKPMKKSDLKLGSIVECRNGNVYMLIEALKHKILIRIDYANEDFDWYDENLCNKLDSQFDIIKVYSGDVDAQLSNMFKFKGALLWERSEEITELTLEDVAKKFNVNVKNVRIKK